MKMNADGTKPLHLRCKIDCDRDPSPVRFIKDIALFAPDRFLLSDRDNTPLSEVRAMHERLMTQSYALRSPIKASSEKPLLVCFSHLRWDFVWQRPQHLLSRAVKHYDVLIIEEPTFERGATPRMDVSKRPGGITIAVPRLPEGLSEYEIVAWQRRLVDRLLGREPDSPRILWYYTPM